MICKSFFTFYDYNFMDNKADNGDKDYGESDDI